MQDIWNFEQLLGLSPDHFTIRSGRGNAKQNKWLSLGKNEHLVWGEFDNKHRPPYQVALDFTHMQFSCNCTSRKFPCHHIIGLHLLWHYSSELFEDGSVPAWVRLYQTRFLQQWHRNTQLSTALISVEALDSLKNGLNELERWLHDLIQNGLAALPDKQKAYWTTIANRMADIQAMTLSHQLLELSNIGQSQADWPESYLKRLSPLALLVAGFKRFEKQSLQVQADLITATGRPLPMFSNGRSPLYDQWLVLGHRSETVSQQQHLVTWLWGLNHECVAQMTQIIKGKHPSGVRYITGSVLGAELQYRVSATPLGAQFVTKPTIRKAPDAQLGNPLILNAIQLYTNAKVKNPWLQRYPLILKEMTPLFENGRWTILDSQNYSLPLPPKFNYGWHLQALASSQAVSIFGIWDGCLFEPISAYLDHSWVDLHTFRGIK